MKGVRMELTTDPWTFILCIHNIPGPVIGRLASKGIGEDRGTHLAVRFTIPHTKDREILYDQYFKKLQKLNTTIQKAYCFKITVLINKNKIVQAKDIILMKGRCIIPNSSRSPAWIVRMVLC